MMKNKFWRWGILILSVISVLAFAACDGEKGDTFEIGDAPGEKNQVEIGPACTKLEYELNEDGQTYKLIGRGDCGHTEVVIPDTHKGKPVTVIGNRSFYKDLRLESVVVGNNVETIEQDAFRVCENLKSVRVSGSVKTMEMHAFFGSYHIEKVYVEDLAAWCKIDFDQSESNPLYGANLYLNNKLVKELVIPDDIEEIHPYAFMGCKSIFSLIIGDGTHSIGNLAFDRNQNLVSVTFGKSVKAIDGAFTHTNIAEIYNKSSLKLSNGLAENIYSPSKGTSKLSCDKNGCIIYTEGNEKSYVGYIGEKEYRHISDGITNIKNYVGENLNGEMATELYLPSSVKSVECYVGGASVIYYGGDKAQFDSIENRSGSLGISYSSDIYYYSENKPETESWKYWHFVNGKPTKW